MASTLDFAEFICDQIRSAGEITYRKMFGEYGVYCDGKIIGLICDNQFFVKKTEVGALLMPDCAEGSPYSGAKPHFLMEDVDDREKLSEFIAKTASALPLPKPKKKKGQQITN